MIAIKQLLTRRACYTLLVVCSAILAAAAVVALREAHSRRTNAAKLEASGAEVYYFLDHTEQGTLRWIRRHWQIDIIDSVHFVRLNDHAVTQHDLECISKMVNLSGIDLNNTGIGDRDLHWLATVKTLRQVQLRDNAVSDTGLRTLCCLKGLRFLDVRHTKVTDDACRKMQEEHPMLQLLY